MKIACIGELWVAEKCKWSRADKSAGLNSLRVHTGPRSTA